MKVIAIDSVTGEVITSSHQVLNSNTSSAGDSVHSGVYSTSSATNSKIHNSFHFGLDKFNKTEYSNHFNDGTFYISSGISNLGNSVSAIGDNIFTSSQISPQTLINVSSPGAVTVPQVIIVDAKAGPSLLGKRPADGSVVHSGNNVINKVIITKSQSSSQPQAVPVQLQAIPAGQAPSTGSQVPRTPTKTITISQQGIVSPARGMTLAQVAGTPPKLPINKLLIPVPRRSPQRIAPAGHALITNSDAAANASSSSTMSPSSATFMRPPGTMATITMSPSKVVKQPGTVHVIQKPIQPSFSNPAVLTIQQTGATTASSGIRQVTIQPGNVQQIHVPGNKFHYIRLATPVSVTKGARTQLLPVTSPATMIAAPTVGQPMKITFPTQTGTQVVTSRPVGSTSTVQRIILPAVPNQIQIRPAPAGISQGAQIIRTTLSSSTSNLAQLAANGATILSAGGNTSGVQGYALVPASYLSHIQQQMQVKPALPSNAAVATTTTEKPTTQARAEFVSMASSTPVASTPTQNKNINGSSLDGGARPRKPCNCTKSQCLKLYCDCFANGEFCHNCNCMNCANNLEHEEDRSRAIKSCLDRNPQAFHPKIGKGRAGERDRRHNKGCNCKRSGCLKNYCECYEAKIMCSSSCKCIGCKNFEESPERKTLMHLADAAEVRVQQQTAAKIKLSSQMSDLPARPICSVTGERLPFSFVTSEVVEATTACLLAQAEEAERQKMPAVVQERMVIEEFGRCLMQIIESANRTKAPDPDDTG